LKKGIKNGQDRYKPIIQKGVSMPSRKKNFNLPVFKNEAELTGFLEDNFTQSLKQLIRITVKLMIKEEMKDFREDIYQLMGGLSFNGHYNRKMVGPFGTVEEIPVPRFRDNPTNFQAQTLSVFGEQQEKFFQLVGEMHRMGVSQRKIKHLVKTCLGTNISTNRVGTIHRQLAETEEANINSTALDDDFAYLLADGLWTKTKGYGWDTNKSVLLCVLGVRSNGERKIIGFTVTRSESYQDWHQLLLSIKQRGLAGRNLKLIISDDTDGLAKACDQLFPQTPLQSCIVHKLRNVIGKASYKNRKEVAADAKQVYRQETKKQALITVKAFCKKWYLKEPKAVNSFKHNFLKTITYHDFDRKLWTKIRTTNILEREFREVRRRIKVFDSSFNSIDSHTRYAGSIINYLNQNYPAVKNPNLHTES
jgi:transposase-like protein